MKKMHKDWNVKTTEKHPKFIENKINIDETIFLPKKFKRLFSSNEINLPKAIKVRLDTVSFQILILIVVGSRPGLLTTTFLSILVMTSILDMNLSATIEIPKKR